MKVLLLILFLFVIQVGYSQTFEVDTSVTSKYRIVKTAPEQESPPEDQTLAPEKEDKGIGDVLFSLGEGFINRLKYRFNLDEAIEEKSKKYKKGK